MLAYLERKAGALVAEKYAQRLEATILRLVELPRSGAPRQALGRATRCAILAPFVLFYDYVAEEDTVTLLRILHGRRRIASAAQ